MTVSIEARDLLVRYNARPAIDRINVLLRGPGIHGLLGRNGSGKTSLLSVFAGFRRPDAGEVRFEGKAVFENAHATSQICLIREGGDTVEGGEKVAAALDFAATMRRSWDMDFAHRLLDRFGLSLSTKIGALSRGQRAALACTLGLASRCPLTMFDEVYLGMDAPSRSAFYEVLLADYMEHPRLIVLSTHLIAEVSGLLEDVVIIDRGKLIIHDKADALSSKGVRVTGPASVVDAFVKSTRILSQKELGPTKSAALFGPITQDQEKLAMQTGLELQPLPLEDLFTHLTAPIGKETR